MLGSPYELRSDPAPFGEHEAAYLAARAREGRLLDVEQIRALPAPPTPESAWEWRLRADSWLRFELLLGSRPRPLRALDVGCGIGWMTARLAQHCPNVLGIDVARPELERAAVAFGDRPGLSFAFADVFDPVFAEAPFDLIVLASSAQYFPDLGALLDRLLELLGRGGEVVLLDTPLYRENQLSAAREATRRYYARLEVPEMAARYHHHQWSALDGRAVELVYDPRRLVQRFARRVLRRAVSPFPIVTIRRSPP